MILSYLLAVAVICIQIWYWVDKNGHKDEIEASQFNEFTIAKLNIISIFRLWKLNTHYRFYP